MGRFERPNISEFQNFPNIKFKIEHTKIGQHNLLTSEFHGNDSSNFSSGSIKPWKNQLVLQTLAEYMSDLMNVIDLIGNIFGMI